MDTAVFENMKGSHGTSADTRKGLPKEGQATDNDGGHGLWRIALYYIYIEMTPSQVKSHIDTQKRTCEELGLKGRIRVSEEGVNAVLSGLLEKLYLYENIISRALQRVATEEKDEKQNTTNDNEEDSDTEINLDIKYCELRSELPVAKQKFDRLIVKETKNVIGLFDQSGQQGQQQKYAKSEKYRRKRERKRQQQEARRQTKIETLNQSDSQQSHSPTASSIPADGKNMGNQSSAESTNKQNVTPESDSLDMTSLYQSVMEEPLKPARHLSAMEWNEKLDQVASSDKSALLLDVRNVYEMKVGHFVHPSTPTLLTNTRKYSDLPQILASNEEMKKRDQIFMYCTGGVRCERVSMLVHELYPEKEIFQLQGGIQRYLESCSERNKQQERQGSSLDSTGANINYFDGKNFVSISAYSNSNLSIGIP